MQSRLKSVAVVTVALALCASPTMATAATSSSAQSLNPLVAVSIYGTQASAQTVCANAASTAAAAGVAATSEAQANCVLPMVDAPPPPPQTAAAPPQVSGFGISPVLLGLLGIAVLAALIAGSNEDSDSPASPS